MKRLLLIVLPLLLMVGCSKTPTGTNLDTLNKRGGTYYEINSEEPFSGQVFSLYENGQKKWEGTYKDGKLISEKNWNKDGSVKE